ncbi:MAG: hypothetical protein LBV36_05680 [Chromatiales bacterium]|nr:hypothetical protein [Chromatiales bacterium]
MADDAAAAVIAVRRKTMDCAFKAVEYVPLAHERDFERLMIFISADFALGHVPVPLADTCWLTR